MSKHEEDRCIYVPEKYIKELEQKAKDGEYFRGRVDGMEYVIDSIFGGTPCIGTDTYNR